MTVTVLVTSIAPRRQERARAVQSVLDQTRLPDSLIVSIDHHHDGAIATRNRDLMAASTEWVCLVDDDDWLLPEHLETVLQAAERESADVVYTIPEAGTVTRYGHPFDAPSLRAGNYIHTIGVLMRTALAQQVSGFENAPGTHFEDWGLWLKLLDAGARFHHEPAVTCHWSFYPGSTMGQPENW